MAINFATSVFLPGPGGALVYPSQSKQVPAPQNVAGELRMYYGGDILKPKSSTHGLVRTIVENGVPVPHPHNGVDIYVPSHPFPDEVPLVAICAGRVEQRYQDEWPNAMGNRVLLWPTGGGAAYLVYGHLNRFEGRGGKVAKGQVIGYGGCSGNADTAGECRTAGVHRITSGHLHLSWMTGTGMETLNPLAQLGWSLRFAVPDTPMTSTQWATFGHLLDEAEKPPIPTGHLKVVVRGRDAAGVPVLEEALKRVKKIERADRDAIAPTLACYAVAAARLAATQPTPAKERFHDFGTAGFAASLDDITRILDRIATIRSRIDALRAKLTPELGTTDQPTPEDITEVHCRLAEVLFIGTRALWLAFGGPALRAVSIRPYKPDSKPANHVDVLGDVWSGRVPDGAFGMNGHSYAQVYASAVAAFHLSRLTRRNPASGLDQPFSAWTLVVGFGPGSGDHAILDALVTKAAGVANGHRAAARAVIAAVRAQMNLLNLVTRAQPSVGRVDLAGQIGGIGTGYLGGLDALRTALSDARQALVAIPAAGRKDWLGVLARCGRDAAQAALDMRPLPPPPPAVSPPPPVVVANEFILFALAPPPPPPVAPPVPGP